MKFQIVETILKQGVEKPTFKIVHKQERPISGTDSDYDVISYKMEMYISGQKIGQVISGYNEEEEQPESDVDIIESQRNKGYGKILLLKKIQMDYELLGRHSMDARGLTEDMGRVYNSLERDGYIQSKFFGIYELTPKGQKYLDREYPEI
jgi:hypothetical protein